MFKHLKNILYLKCKRPLTTATGQLVDPILCIVLQPLLIYVAAYSIPPGHPTCQEKNGEELINTEISVSEPVYTSPTQHLHSQAANVSCSNIKSEVSHYI